MITCIPYKLTVLVNIPIKTFQDDTTKHEEAAAAVLNTAVIAGVSIIAIGILLILMSRCKRCKNAGSKGLERQEDAIYNTKLAPKMYFYEKDSKGLSIQRKSRNRSSFRSSKINVDHSFLMALRADQETGEHPSTCYGNMLRKRTGNVELITY